ncbi:putative Asparagine-rich zinc finger protein AZF1 [Glarea lozoyensis 74030]|uniref:Putative Asparagine-rich zinc finger protein AZF1 n=1 Tax=Glarea lozoyensis (strain ATCC 74030 / MF5533) TaxID=1104152 RepID=H0ENA0_GLAL7|nr:putative Asparagine-rich zinc finger protein AZF1 [Glarea lozoyensis 74030]
MQQDNEVRAIAYSRASRAEFVEEHSNQSPLIKSEPIWGVSSGSPPTPVTFSSTNTNPISSTTSPISTTDVNFGTDVDTLMKAIQAKSQTSDPQTSAIEQSRPVVTNSPTPPYAHTNSQSTRYASSDLSPVKLAREQQHKETHSTKSTKKRYQCTIENCTKKFQQKTHLDIHERSHTGIKPYECKDPGCGRSFSQLGNLKTHERRHTGERPYQCEQCGKRFAQRGNVRAHKIVHDHAKPYLCRLDDCGKQFTQLGNLKNKFHAATIRKLTSKFASIKDGDIVHSADKELWEYFANLYKNSNKGIKGRGKDRKVGANPHAMSTVMRSQGPYGVGLSGSGRGNMVMGVMNHGLVNHGPVQRGEQYEIFDVDDESQSGRSGSGAGSSVGTIYDDAPSDSFEDQRGDASHLAFGDRIY